MLGWGCTSLCIRLCYIYGNWLSGLVWIKHQQMDFADLRHKTCVYFSCSRFAGFADQKRLSASFSMSALSAPLPMNTQAEWTQLAMKYWICSAERWSFQCYIMWDKKQCLYLWASSKSTVNVFLDLQSHETITFPRFSVEWLWTEEREKAGCDDIIQ